ncbi:MAG: carbohydrate ABC transporter permease [Firmicutes bacterium]|nr:carbohydrate ABC transporter permease [Bacillota bacterium]
MLLAFFALIFLFPGFLTLLNSFKTNTEIKMNPLQLPTRLSITNYVEAWREMEFPVVLANTFILTSLSTLGIILVSSMAAYALVRYKWRTSWVLFLLFTFSMVVPFQAIMVPLFANAKNMGLLSVLGLVPIYVALGCPMAIFMFHGFIKSVPEEIEESAAIDGASPLRCFFQIVLPLLTPVIGTVAILDVLWIWNDFLLPLLMIPGRTLQLAQYRFVGIYRQEYHLAMASLVLTASPVVLFYLFMQRYIINGISAGAIKG